MRLRQTLITNAAMLKSHFDFAEIWQKRQLFLKDIGDIRPDMDRERREALKGLLCQCTNSEGKLNTVPAQLPKQALSPEETVMYEEIREGLSGAGGLASLDEALRTNAAAAVLSIYCLCGIAWKDADAQTISGIFCRMDDRAGEPAVLAGELSAGDGGCVELTGEGGQDAYRIEAYDYSSPQGRIARVRYQNCTGRTGEGRDLRILVCDSLGTLDEFLLKPGESLFANLLNGQFVEAVPNLALSSSHCMFYDGACRFGQVPYALCAFDLEERTSNSYDFPAIAQLTEFCPDDSGGFVGVLNPDGLPMPCSEKTEFRRIYEHTGIARILLNNATYLILGKDGRVWSNLEKADGWEDMLRVFLSVDGEEAIGIRRDGGAVFTGSGTEPGKLLDRAYSVAFDYKPSAASLSLAAKLPGGRFLAGTAAAGTWKADERTADEEAHSVKAFSLGGIGLRVLFYDGRLLECGRELYGKSKRRFKEYASQGDNYAAVDTEGRLLLVCAGEELLNADATDRRI